MEAVILVTQEKKQVKKGELIIKKHHLLAINLVFFTILVNFCFAKDDQIKKIQGPAKFAQKNIESLSKFDGIKNDIFGPFDIQIPKTFFVEDLVTSIETSGNYWADIEAQLNGLSKAHLVIKKKAPHTDNHAAMVVSISIPGGKYRNYIIEFGDKNEILLSADKELIKLFRNERLDAEFKGADSFYYENWDTVNITVISSDNFTCKLITPVATEEAVVNEPKSSNAEMETSLTINAYEPCCYSTSGNKRRTLVVSNAPYYDTAIAWIKIDRFFTSSQPYWEEDGYLTAYYPTQNQVIHTTTSPSHCRRDNSVGNTCYQGFDYFFTYSIINCNGTSTYSTYKWWDMDKFVNNNGYGMVQRMSGCQIGRSWKMYRD